MSHYHGSGLSDEPSRGRAVIMPRSGINLGQDKSDTSVSDFVGETFVHSGRQRQKTQRAVIKFWSPGGA